MSIKTYILEKDFKLTITNNWVDIVNYQEINLFDDNHIIIKNNDKFITISGNNLIINKWLDNEILVSGEVVKIELR